MNGSNDRQACAPEPHERGTRRAALLLFLLALLVYGGAQVLHTGTLLARSPFPYFTYYAEALLEGQLHFRTVPPSLVDLSMFEGKIYMHFPPFPAVLLMPFVKAFGLDAPDRLLSVVLGALNGALFHLLLARLHRRGLLASSPGTRLGLSLFFLFGTVHFYLAVTGNPWETAHVVANTLVLLAFHATLARRYLAAALALAALVFTRSHVVLVAPLLFLLALRQETGPLPARLLRLLPAALTVAGGALLLLFFNHARFGDWFENGISYHAMHPLFRQRFERYGYFDTAYLGRNLEALFLLTPVAQGGFPWFTFTPKGLSLFLASPLYLYLFRSVRAGRRGAALVTWAAVLLAAAPILLLMGTGEFQFGHRYSSDLQVLLCLLLLAGLGSRMTRAAWILLALSILMNAYGTFWFVSRFAG